MHGNHKTSRSDINDGSKSCALSTHQMRSNDKRQVCPFGLLEMI